MVLSWAKFYGSLMKTEGLRWFGSFFTYIWALIISVVMHIRLTLFLILISSSIFGQEIGNVSNGIYSMKLLKSDNLFSWVYSDVNSKPTQEEKSFNFSNIETIYNIIMDGFENKYNHQIIVHTDIDTVIKFEYKTIKGQMLLNINHNNMNSKIAGISTSLSREQLITLFGKQL
jgi:hypothetical protein